MLSIRPIDSPETMISAIRQMGIVPFFHNAIPGWSIEDHTAPGHWFGKEEEGGSLGPWDWKIDAIREGDIAYGKYISRKTAFATREWYGHLMNWRRSLPEYRMAEGYDHEVTSIDGRLDKYLASVLLAAIREKGSLESGEIKAVLKQRLDRKSLEKVGGWMRRYLVPDIKKQAIDIMIQYLDMGTWTLIGDFTRVYRGPNLTYSGWQRSSITTPDELFKSGSEGTDGPFWAKFIDAGDDVPLVPDCTPAESREKLIGHILSLNPGTDRKAVEKLI